MPNIINILISGISVMIIEYLITEQATVFAGLPGLAKARQQFDFFLNKIQPVGQTNLFRRYFL